MKVLVTGAAGFIGSHITDALITRGDEVLAVDNLSGGKRDQVNAAAEFRELDIRDPEAAALIREWRPDAVCHHAAQMSVSVSVREPLFDADVNVRGALQLLEAASAVDARFIFASTGGVIYGDADVLPTPETYPAWPICPYGVSKLAFEHYLHCYREQHGLRYVALRYGNVYGPRQNPHGEAGVVAIFCLRMLSEEQPIINGDGGITRDYVFVEDIVRANLAALDSDIGRGHFNVGTGVQSTVNEIFQSLSDYLASSTPEIHGPPRQGDQRRSALDSSLIARELGWRAQIEFTDGLRRTADWFREQVTAPGLAR